MRTLFFALSSSLLLLSCQNAGGKVSTSNLQDSIQKDSSFNLVKDMATNVIKSGFNAGDGYSEVWIRDYNTFITLAKFQFIIELNQYKFLGSIGFFKDKFIY